MISSDTEEAPGGEVGPRRPPALLRNSTLGAFRRVSADGGSLPACGARTARIPARPSHPSGPTSILAIARTVRIPVIDGIAAAIRALDPEQQGVYCVDPKESAGGQAEITETNAGRFLRRRICRCRVEHAHQLMRGALGERAAAERVLSARARPLLGSHGGHGLRARPK